MPVGERPRHIRSPRWARALKRLGWNGSRRSADRANGKRGRREVILYYSHFKSPAVLRELKRLSNELNSHYDIFAIGYCRTSGALAGIKCVPVREYSRFDLTRLPYPGKAGRFNPSDYRGNCDLAPMKFFLERPDYDYYWIIEYDVRFSGPWPELFADLSQSKADLLGTTVQSWTENPQWAHWDTLVTGHDDVPMEQRVKSFIPFCRASRALLRACDERYRRGWGGHSEVVWPTVSRLAGLSLEDIGGSGNWTPPERRGRYYTNTPSEWSQFPGTFVYRPSFADRNLFGRGCHFSGTLWHPVKE